MKLPILSFVFIVLWHVSAAQETNTINNSSTIQETLTNNNNNNSVTEATFTNNDSQIAKNCPLMEVRVNSNDNGIIEVSYCNHGNMPATGVYVEVEITNDLVITQVAPNSISIPPIINEKYIFNVDDVNSLDCAAFYLEVPNFDKKVDCINIQIFPNNPCQAMIDRYIINNTGSDDDDDDDDDDDGDDTSPTAVTFSAKMHHSVPGPPVLGQGGTNSVFEDHVFLNNIPTWDSLLFVLTNSGVLPNTGNTNTPNGSTLNGLDDITVLTSTKLCSISNGSTVVLTDILSQTTGIAIGDRTTFVGSVDDNQTFSNGGAIRSEGKALGENSNKKGAAALNEIKEEKQKYENREVVVHLYPNPFSTKATITIDGVNYQETRLEILDLAGKTLQSLEFNKQESITLYRENLVQGVYFYRLIGDNAAVHTGKFVIR